MKIMPLMNKFYIEIHRIVTKGPIEAKFNHFPPIYDILYAVEAQWV